MLQAVPIPDRILFYIRFAFKKIIELVLIVKIYRLIDICILKNHEITFVLDQKTWEELLLKVKILNISQWWIELWFTVHFQYLFCDLIFFIPKSWFINCVSLVYIYNPFSMWYVFILYYNLIMFLFIYLTYFTYSYNKCASVHGDTCWPYLFSQILSSMI